MKDERRDEMMKTPNGRRQLRTEMVQSILNAAQDLAELNRRDAWGTSFAQLEEAENCLLIMLDECDPGCLLEEIRRLEMEVVK